MLHPTSDRKWKSRTYFWLWFADFERFLWLIERKSALWCHIIRARDSLGLNFSTVKFTIWIEEVWEGGASKLLRKKFSFLSKINRGSIKELGILKLLHLRSGVVSSGSLKSFRFFSCTVSFRSLPGYPWLIIFSDLSWMCTYFSPQ